jgi:predicted ribosome-associated RNA-binding protein Tma20
MDTFNLEKSSENLSIINELQKYDASLYFSTDEKLITKYGQMLFFKENEKEFPTLSEIAKMPRILGINFIF